MLGLSGKSEEWPFPGKFWEANTVADFWSKWNPAVHNGLLKALRFVRRKARTRIVVIPTVLFIFLVMGLYHDGVVWLLAGYWEDYGFQYIFTIFFLMNGLVVILERLSGLSIPLPVMIKKILTFSWIIGSFIFSLNLNLHLLY